jgi:hypothetical protein
MSSSSPKDGESQEVKAGDRRAHQRRAIVPRLYVILYGANSDGILNDVSEGGAALDILGSQPEGDYIVVDFDMAEIGQHFEAKGRITWRDEVGQKVGVNFVDLPETSRNQIRQWLLKKMAREEPAQPAIVQDAGRRATPILPRVPQEAAPGAPEHARSSTPETKPPGEQALPRSRRSRDLDGERLVQNLIDSFSKRHNKPSEETSKPQPANIFSLGQAAFSAWSSRGWMVLTAAVCLAVVIVLGVLAYRSPAHNVEKINVSKVGRLPNTEPEKTTLGDDSANSTGAAVTGSPPSVLSSLPNASSAGHPPCVNLGPPTDKIRIYLWAEKDTPDAIVATYTNYLKAVVDVRMVAKAPYDLVLYVNGANAGAKGPQSGFIWSSRVFRPWYCGQALGLLEQTKVNESLHYVQGADLDHHIQAEIAYLILHTFETIRNEHTR